MNIDKIQEYLKENKLDGWLMSDFHGRNEIAMRILNIKGMLTRRFFYFIPADGKPIALIHKVEKNIFKNLGGDHLYFSSYTQLESNLKEILDGHFLIAMEYSPNGRLPYIGLVDAGTIELIRSYGVEIVTSADMVAHFLAKLNDQQVESHQKAAILVNQIKDNAFAFIKESLDSNKKVTEYDVTQFIRGQFKNNNMVTDHSPICGVDANAGNPHYEPTAEVAAEIKKGQLILIDLWAKLNQDDAVFADITWMGFAGSKQEIPEKYSKIFSVLAQARDKAVETLKEKIGRQEVYGSEIDDACRNVIEDAGFGDYFVHRTGHSITTDVHGTGPNIDNLETEDSRKLQIGHLFSIEPGIYLDDCGFRTEIDVYITANGPEIATLPLQTEILALY